MGLYKEGAPEPISASDINQRLSRSAERTITISNGDTETRYLAMRDSASSITFADYHNKFIVTTGQFSSDSRIRGYAASSDLGSTMGSISEDVITSGNGSFEWIFSHSGEFKDATITSLYSFDSASTNVRVFYFKMRHSGTSLYSGSDNVDNWTSIRLRNDDTTVGTAFEYSYASWSDVTARWTWSQSSNLRDKMGSAGDRRYVEFN